MLRLEALEQVSDHRNPRPAARRDTAAHGSRLWLKTSAATAQHLERGSMRPLPRNRRQDLDLQVRTQCACMLDAFDEMRRPAVAQVSRSNEVMTTYRSFMSWMVCASFSGSVVSGGSGDRAPRRRTSSAGADLTEDHERGSAVAEALVDVGHEASLHTVTSAFSRSFDFSCATALPLGIPRGSTRFAQHRCICVELHRAARDLVFAELLFPATSAAGAASARTVSGMDLAESSGDIGLTRKRVRGVRLRRRSDRSQAGARVRAPARS